MDVIRRLLEGANVRDLLAEDSGPRWVRPHLTSASYWILVSYDSELTMEVEAKAKRLFIYHPQRDTYTLDEAENLAMTLAGTYNGSVKRVADDFEVIFERIEDLIAAMASFGRCPKPTDIQY